MNIKLFLIIFLNFLVIISCIEVKLNTKKNGTIHNYTIIDNSNLKDDLFISEKLFFSKCRCNFNNEIFYVPPSYNIINFTINTSEPYFNESNKIKIKDSNLYINSKKIIAYYSLNYTNENLYKLHIHTICKNSDIKNNLNKVIKNYGLYKIESYSENNHKEFNDNHDFAFLNFTFNYNQTLYYFSFIKICAYNELWKEILSCFFVMLIAFIYIYLSTYMKLKFKIFKELQKMADIKWYHITLGVFCGSGMLILIYFYKNYIFIFLNVLIGFESLFCTYYTILFFILEVSKKLLSINNFPEYILGYIR